MTIWIVRKHQPHPYQKGFLEAFTIHSTHANRADAASVANQKNDHPNTLHFYSVGKVQLKESA